MNRQKGIEIQGPRRSESIRRTKVKRPRRGWVKRALEFASTEFIFMQRYLQPKNNY